MCARWRCSTLWAMTSGSFPIEPSDAGLLARMRDGDARAFELIYARYSVGARALAHRVCGRPRATTGSRLCAP